MAYNQHIKNILLSDNTELLTRNKNKVSTQFNISDLPDSEFKKQIIWIVAGIPILIIMILVDYKILARFSIWFYSLSIILLIAVLFTQRINGARSWFNIGNTSLQPGEFAKVAVILFLSSEIAKMRT